MTDNFAALEIDLAKIRFDPIPDTKALRRVHVFKALAATFVDEELVRDHLDRMAERIQRAKDAATGQGRLDDWEQIEAHERGDHAELVDVCPRCIEEAELAAAGE